MDMIEAPIARKLHEQMLRIRMVEEKICELYSEQEMRCPVHLCVGQEAIPVGVCAHLKPEDYVLSGHRSHGHYLAKGGDLKAMMAEIYGKVTGCCMGKGGSMHLVDLDAGFLAATPIVGSTVPIGVGAALASAMRGEKRVTVVFFGDAAVEEGVLCESINFAVLKKLPVVFVCENNAYSVNSPLSVRQPPGHEIYEIARGHGMESSQADGNDVIAVYELAGKAVDKARQGDGPTFLEFKTYRWLEHCGPNDDSHLECRSEVELQEWKDRCPLRMLEDRLLSEGIASSEEMRRVAANIATEMEEAVRFAKSSAFPEPELLLKHIYAP